MGIGNLLMNDHLQIDFKGEFDIVEFAKLGDFLGLGCGKVDKSGENVMPIIGVARQSPEIDRSRISTSSSCWIGKKMFEKKRTLKVQKTPP